MDQLYIFSPGFLPADGGGSAFASELFGLREEIRRNLQWNVLFFQITPAGHSPKKNTQPAAFRQQFPLQMSALERKYFSGAVQVIPDRSATTPLAEFTPEANPAISCNSFRVGNSAGFPAMSVHE